jgi:2-keto-4-pentenoate hydratase
MVNTSGTEPRAAGIDKTTMALLAERLLDAETRRGPVNPLTETYNALTEDEAYAIQLEGVRLREARGRAVVGKKTGLTSLAMQRLLGIDEPDFGHLLDAMMIGGDQPVVLAELIQPKIEPELAFVLARDLKGPGVTADDVLDATAFIVPALEVVDSRIKDWRIKLADTIADNASSGRVILGHDKIAPRQVDLAGVTMVFVQDQQTIATAQGNAVLGNPANAVAWLANKLAGLGAYLKGGEIVLSGAFCGAVDLKPQTHFGATFSGLGSVGTRVV